MYYELEIVLIIAMLIIGFFDVSDLEAWRKWWSGVENLLKRRNSPMKLKTKKARELQSHI